MTKNVLRNARLENAKYTYNIAHPEAQSFSFPVLVHERR